MKPAKNKTAEEEKKNQPTKKKTKRKKKLYFAGKPRLRQKRKFSALFMECLSLRTGFSARKNYVELVRIDQTLGDFCES
jgi:hypothetical protein